MQPQVQLKSQVATWNSKLRYRVKQVVEYNSGYWQNTTGINSEPIVNSPNWINVGTTSSAISTTGLKLFDRGWTNGVKNTGNYTANDLFYGAIEQGVVWVVAIWKGVDFNDPNDFVPLFPITIDPENQNF